MNDIPYVAGDEVGHEICSTMSAICREVRKVFPSEKPVGMSLNNLPFTNGPSTGPSIECREMIITKKGAHKEKNLF